MEWVTIVALVAVLEYLFFGLQVGRARGTYKVDAPATTGHEMFERAFRIHQNTLEQLVVFLPSLFAFASYVSTIWAAGIGLVFIVGRAVYATGYQAEPKKRGTGMMITFGANAVLLLGGLVGAALKLF
jgi:glutathione S-transferase